MEKAVNKILKMNKRKLGKILFLSGMAVLLLSVILMLMTDSVFSSVLFFFSIILNICGLYIIFWVKDGDTDRD